MIVWQMQRLRLLALSCIGGTEIEMGMEWQCTCLRMCTKSVRRIDLEDEGIETLWIQVKMGRLHVLICDVFRPPDALAAWMDRSAFILERALQEKLSVMMLGGFNCDFLSPNSRANKFALVMEEYGLVQMVDGPTAELPKILNHKLTLYTPQIFAF